VNSFKKKFETKYGEDGKEFVQKWVDALESGKISRITGQLNNGKGMCCLGVACDILSEDGLVEKKSSVFGNFHYNGKKGMPPDSVGLLINKLLNYYTNVDNLSIKNDNGRTFKKTAAVIRTAMKKQGVILK
jgi:hypothetical protein